MIAKCHLVTLLIIAVTAGCLFGEDIQDETPRLNGMVFLVMNGDDAKVSGRCALFYSDEGRLLAFVVGNPAKNVTLTEADPKNDNFDGSLHGIAASINIDTHSIAFTATTAGASVSVRKSGQLFYSLDEVPVGTYRDSNIVFIVYRGDISKLISDLSYDRLLDISEAIAK